MLQLGSERYLRNNLMVPRNYTIMAVLLIGTLHAMAQVSFAPAANYTVGTTPDDVIAADVNGDGKLDLISANSQAIAGQPSTLTVLTNNGSGVFGSNATLNVGSGPHSVAAADVNADGMLDLISANYAGSSLSILTNGVDDVLESNATLNTGSLPDSLVAADVNGDGKIDLICAMNNGLNGILVFTNNGSGGFGSNATYNAVTDCSAIAAADINGDGKVDLICLATDSLVVLTNDGVGAFGYSSTINLSGGPIGLAVADVNNDGKPDLIASIASSPSKLLVWTNSGGGVFGANATYSVGEGIVSIATADVNGDGSVDLICANNESIPGTLLVMTNNGSGVFGSNVTITVESGPWAVIAADVNGDGKPDLICANRNANTVSVKINTSLYPPPAFTPTLAVNNHGNTLRVSWPSAAAGWSLQQNPGLTASNWSPGGYSGYGITEDGTNKCLTMPSPPGNMFFRLLHP